MYRLKLTADYFANVAYRTSNKEAVKLKGNHYEVRLFFGIWDDILVIMAAIFADVEGQQPWMNVGVFHHLETCPWEALPPVPRGKPRPPHGMRWPPANTNVCIGPSTATCMPL